MREEERSSHCLNDWCANSVCSSLPGQRQASSQPPLWPSLSPLCHLCTDTWTCNSCCLSASCMVQALHHSQGDSELYHPSNSRKSRTPSATLEFGCDLLPLYPALGDSSDRPHLVKRWWSKAWEDTRSYGKAESLQPFLGQRSASETSGMMSDHLGTFQDESECW